METTKNANLKNEISLNNLKEAFKDIAMPTQSSSNGEKLIYKFDRQNLTKKETKKLRVKARLALEKIASDFLIAAKKENVENCKTIAKNFNEVYKRDYIVNDYTIGSVRARIANDADAKQIVLLLQFCKGLNA